MDLPPGARRCWSLLVRANRTTGEVACYRCYAPKATTMTRMVALAGRLCAIEESFRAAKGPAGLNEHQVLPWTPWRRWSLLSMYAQPTLAWRSSPLPSKPQANHRPGSIANNCTAVHRLIPPGPRR